ncbi:MAG: acetolactate synthase large subunit, partial [Opitutales bacterium]|nr:acetolactate synthase large subunit [Opitutales bacterium]
MKSKIEPKNAPKVLMRGSDIIVKALELQGVDTVFAYPGGQSIDLHDAFSKSKKIRTILPRHEQSCGFMAQGYARTTGKVGVCMTTSGPGATNVLTAVADAYMDSVPMVILTGQVFQSFIGKSAFQETDVFGMTLPIVKHSYLVLNPHDLPRIIKEAFVVASTGRPGPVLIDIPKDVQLAQIEPDFGAEIDIPGLNRLPAAKAAEIDKLLAMIEKSKQPVIYAGGGVITSGAAKLLDEFSEITSIPVATTLMGLGCANPLSDKNLYWCGMHGTYAGNSAVCNSDLLITIGARFDDRITGVVSKFATNAKIVHIDIDRSEHGKNIGIDFGIHADAKDALELLVKKAKTKSFKKPDLKNWICQIIRWKAEHPYPFANPPREKYITGPAAIKAL